MHMNTEIKKSILIGEDDEILRKTLGEALTKEGYTVIVARDGVETQDLALAKKPHLLVLDIQMPRKSGLEALQAIRRNVGWGDKVPVILLTNMGDPTYIAGALDLKAHDYLVKSDMSLADVVLTCKRKLNNQ